MNKRNVLIIWAVIYRIFVYLQVPTAACTWERCVPTPPIRGGTKHETGFMTRVFDELICCLFIFVVFFCHVLIFLVILVPTVFIKINEKDWIGILMIRWLDYTALQQFFCIVLNIFAIFYVFMYRNSEYIQESTECPLFYDFYISYIDLSYLIHMEIWKLSCVNILFQLLNIHSNIKIPNKERRIWECKISAGKN